MLVAELIDRIASCNHWLGEEPYDEDRAKEIDAAVGELRCDALEADEAKVLERYNSANTRSVLNAAKNLAY